MKVAAGVSPGFRPRKAHGVVAESTIPPLDALRASPRRRQLTVGIIGAGLAGLCSAYELERLGHRVTVFEAEKTHIGGRVRTHRFENGCYGELGAMRIPSVHKTTEHYVREFDLRTRPFVQSNPDAYVLTRGKRVRARDVETIKSLFGLSITELKEPLGSMWSRSVNAVLASLTAEERDDLQRPDPKLTRIREIDQLSILNVLAAGGLSAEAIQLLSSGWGMETYMPISLTEILREDLLETWDHEFYEIVDGMDQLPRAFARVLQKTHLVQNSPVSAVSQNSGGVQVAISHSSGTTLYPVTFDALIVTVPLGPLASIEFLPPLDPRTTAASRRVHYDSATKILALSRHRFWEINDGIFGGGSISDGPLLFSWYPSDNVASKSREISEKPSAFLASYSWGQIARRNGNRSDWRAMLDREVKMLHGLEGESPIEDAIRWSWDRHKWSLGAYAFYQPGDFAQLHRHLLSVSGRVVLAGEHTSLEHSWMQGALNSAIRAALTVLNEITPLVRNC